MAQTKKDIKESLPLPVYNFRVRIDQETYSFSEVSGLSIEYDTITYKHGLSWKEGPEQMPGMKSEVNISLKRGIVSGRSLLYDWLSTIQLNRVEKHNLIIDLCDENGEPVISWTVKNAFPKKLDAPSFNADTNELAIENLDLLASDLKISYHD